MKNIKAKKLLKTTKKYFLDFCHFFKNKATIIAIVYWGFINIVIGQNYFNKLDAINLVARYRIYSLAFAIVLANLIYRIILRAKRDKLYKKFIAIVLIYLAIMDVMLLLTWPGAYGHDDYQALTFAQNLKIFAQHHVITGFFMNIAIMLLPIASAPIILQIIIASLVVAYLTTFLPTIIFSKKKTITILRIMTFAVFMLPPVVFYTLTGYRLGLYQYLEVFLLIFVYIHWRKKQKLNIPETILLLFIAILVSAWRSECIYYLAAFPIILLIVRKQLLITLKQIAIYSLIIIVSTVGISKYNTHLIGNSIFTVGGFILPASGIVTGALDEGHPEDTVFFDKIFDISCAINRTKLQDPDDTFFPCRRTNYTEEDAKNFIKQTIVLAPKYLNSVASFYADSFCDAVLTIKCTNKTQSKNTGYHGNIQAYWATSAFERREDGTTKFESNIKLPLNKPISRKIRAGTIKLLTGYKSAGEPYGFVHHAFYNIVTPTIALLIAFIMAIRRKNLFLIFLIMLVAVRFVAVTLGGMVSFTMYYLPYYISSYILLIVSFDKIQKNTKKTKNGSRK